MKISSALRTISHFTVYAGPLFGRDVVPHLAINRKILVVENEVASAIYRHDEPEIAKHCAAIIRETYTGEEQREAVVVAAALAETAHGETGDEVPAVVTALGLDTANKKLRFLERYDFEIADHFVMPSLRTT